MPPCRDGCIWKIPRCRPLAELVGTLLLLAMVVGSGIMGETLAQGSAGITLLGNTGATGAAVGLIE